MNETILVDEPNYPGLKTILSEHQIIIVSEKTILSSSGSNIIVLTVDIPSSTNMNVISTDISTVGADFVPHRTISLR